MSFPACIPWFIILSSKGIILTLLSIVTSLFLCLSGSVCVTVSLCLCLSLCYCCHFAFSVLSPPDFPYNDPCDDMGFTCVTRTLLTHPKMFSWIMSSRSSLPCAIICLPHVLTTSWTCDYHPGQCSAREQRGRVSAQLSCEWAVGWWAKLLPFLGWLCLPCRCSMPPIA